MGTNRIRSRKKLSLEQTGKEVSTDTRNDISCLSVATGGGSYILIKSVDMLAGKPFSSKQPGDKPLKKIHLFIREQANNPGFVVANQLTTQSKKLKKFSSAYLAI